MRHNEISDDAAFAILEDWFQFPVDQRVRFRAFCLAHEQFDGFGDNDFQYVSSLKRVADTFEDPLKYVYGQMALQTQAAAAPEDNIIDRIAVRQICTNILLFGLIIVIVGPTVTAGLMCGFSGLPLLGTPNVIYL
jgi:hypothetical protein